MLIARSAQPYSRTSLPNWQQALINTSPQPKEIRVLQPVPASERLSLLTPSIFQLHFPNFQRFAQKPGAQSGLFHPLGACLDKDLQEGTADKGALHLCAQSLESSPSDLGEGGPATGNDLGGKRKEEKRESCAPAP